MKATALRSKSGTKRKVDHAKTIRIVLLVALLGALGGTIWWYFWGSKPQLKLSIPITATDGTEPQCWPVGENGLAVLGGGSLTLVHIAERRQLWSVPVPLPIKVDYRWQASVAQRFLKLQQRATELSAARANLKGEAAIKAFNAEASKYATDLAAARADAARPTASVVPPKDPAPDGKSKPKEFTLGDDRSSVDKLNAIRTEAETIRMARMVKRAEQIAKLRSSINELRAKADTRLKLQQLREDEARLTALESEQRADETPKAPLVAPAPEDHKTDADFGFSSGGKSQLALLGETLWLAEGSRVLGFERSSGGLKSTINLPGPVVKMCAGPESLVVAAHAGKSIRYLLKVAPDGNTQTNYITVSGEHPALSPAGEGSKPVIVQKRSVFVGASAPAIAEIRLVKEAVEERPAFKPGAETEAEAAVQSTAGGGAEEALAILKVVENDKLRAETGGVEQIDASTYEVKLRSLFAPASAEWTGQFNGRVQFFSTASFNLLTGGTKLVVLNSANAKVWEASLAAPALIGDDHQWMDSSALPCVETADKLYFFDRAVLTAFNKASGDVLWRLPSVGIRKIAIAGDDHVYVHSSNLSAESLVYLSDSDSGGEPILMKLNSADGSIVWTSEKLDSVWASGKELYSLRIARPQMDLVNAAFKQASNTEARSKIYKLNSKTGKARWEWFQPRTPIEVVARGKTLAILFSDGVQLVHSTSL